MSKSSFFSGTGVSTTNTDAIESSTAAAAASESAAAVSATSAATSASSASANVATNAASAAASEASRQAALVAKTAAETAETNAETAQAAALVSQNGAATSAASSETSKATSVNSAATSTTKAAEASTSETNAAASAATATTKASDSETARAASVVAKDASVAAKDASVTAKDASVVAKNASVAAQAAAETAETNSETAETNAASSASSASTSASTATTKASEASTSATASETSKVASEAAKDAALAALDSFDDRYLGSKSSAPTVDNDGDALASGMLYFNTTTDEMKVYDGSQWLNAYASLSGALLATSNLSDLNNAGTARTNLGLGTAATTAASAYATAAQGTKVDAIEASATADQTGAEIKTAYEAETNAFTDAQFTKLGGIEALATVTNTTSVTAAGALMDSELTAIASVKALNQGVATTDDPTFTNTQLAAIAQSKSDTAVDVFVYDTSKDSDGGAWRNRTQNTSWYNEALNTSTRGATKKFPSVAVIVAESDTVTIYDGDDPDMPMWRVFNRDTNTPAVNNAWYRDASSFVVSSVAMKNGSLIFGVTVTSGTSNTSAGLLTADFIADELRRRSSAASTSVRGVPVAESNNNPVLQLVTSDPLISTIINDIAITVLPNAPIDADTGLPVPTIAVATEGGVSVIKDDGSVVDFTNSSGSGYSRSMGVSFTKNNQIRFMMDASDRFYRTYNIPEADATVAQWSATSDQGLTVYTSPAYGDVPNIDYQTIACVEENAVGGGNGLLKFEQNDPNPAASLFNYITSSYNTGWMNGDIKLATLSDTDTTNAVGTELVTNGTFASNTTGWTVSAEGAISVDNGKLKILNVSDRGRAYQTGISVTAGKHYVLQFDATTGSTTGFTHVSGGTATANNIPQYVPFYFYATGSTINLQFGVGTANNGDYTYYDNISIREVEEDRSVNGKGLQVFGTVTKSAVATGADLVAYSGFSSSNYLVQPYNSDLDFGTGDFSIMGWVSTTSTSPQTLLHRGDGNASGWGTSPIIQIELSGTFKMGIYTGGFAGATAVADMPASELATGSMRHVVITQSGGYLKLYVDNVLKNSTSSTGTVTNTSANTWIGSRPYSARPWLGSLALWRISATAPTPEQIAKIHNDEKHLFQEGAQATLYGTSDAVTALAYDDDTELLHAGTSAGRSVFQGLRRVENTTDAVGSAISASNGLVAED